MMLRRLSDRIEGKDSSGKDIIIQRFGLWGTNLEVEHYKKDWVVVHPNKKKMSFSCSDEAEKYLREYMARGIE